MVRSVRTGETQVFMDDHSFMYIYIYLSMYTHTRIHTYSFLFSYDTASPYTHPKSLLRQPKFHPNQNLIFSKRPYAVLIQPSTPGYLMYFAPLKWRDQGAFKRSSAQQQQCTHGCLHSKATLGTVTVSRPPTRELWWNNHTSSGHPTAVQASFATSLQSAFI